jgi:mannose-6-phosphate isomerase class I
MSPNNRLISSFGASGVATDLVPIEPSDSVDLPFLARSIRCRSDGAAGTIRFVSFGGVLRNSHIGAGEVLLVAASRVHATGTTATLLEAMV